MDGTTEFCVTTSLAAGRVRFDAAMRAAREWGVDFVPRSMASLTVLRRRFPAVVVFESQGGVRLVDSIADACYSAGMAYRRIARIRSGQTDALCTIADIGPGMAVVDTTLGLGRDALVAASIVGPTGSVVCVEASAPLAAFTAIGMNCCSLPLDRVEIGRVDVHQSEAASWLHHTNQSFDIALIDPMFDRPRRADAMFDLLRRHARQQPLGDCLLEAALGRAERAVVRVGHPSTLHRLHRRAVDIIRSGKTVWGVFVR